MFFWLSTKTVCLCTHADLRSEVAPIPKLRKVPASKTVFGDEAMRHDGVETMDQLATCSAFRWERRAATAPPRRLFLGALIADEQPLVLELLAWEIAGIISMVSFVEAPVTQSGQPRKLLYASHGPRFSWLFHLFREHGVAINVSTPGVLQNAPKWAGLRIERFWRQWIVHAWIAAGMRAHDVGIVSDPDEVFTRDTLLALRDCDSPHLRPAADCAGPKFMASTVIFEGNLDCVWHKRRWYHPDAMSGECIAGVGSSLSEDDMLSPINRKIRPGLWTVADFRSRPAKDRISTKSRVTPVNSNVNAYHFHNFHTSEAWIRHKYSTFGHANPKAVHMSLGEIARDVNLSLNCQRGTPDPLRSLPHYTFDWQGASQHQDKKTLAKQGWRALHHSLPRLVVEAAGCAGPGVPPPAPRHRWGACSTLMPAFLAAQRSVAHKRHPTDSH